MKFLYFFMMIFFMQGTTLFSSTDYMFTSTHNNQIRPLPQQLPLISNLYQVAIDSINILHAVNQKLQKDIIENFINLEDIQFLKTIIGALKKIDWQTFNQQLPSYIKIYNQYQSDMAALKKQRQDALKKILEKNEDASIVAKLIAPEELEKMVKDTSVKQYTIKPTVIKQFFLDQQKISDDFAKKEQRLLKDFLTSQKKLTVFNQLHGVKMKIITYLSARTQDKTIQKALQNLSEKPLFDRELWKGLASQLAHIFFNAIADYNQGVQK